MAIKGVVENGNSGELILRNTGKLNLYLIGFRFNEEEDKVWVFEHPRLIAANTSGDPGYPIRPGKEAWKIISNNPSATLTLFLKDEIDRKWISEHGLFKVSDKGLARICSYSTFGETWELKLPKNRTTSYRNAEYIEGAYFIRGVKHNY